MFQFRAFPSYGYLIHRTIPEYCSGVLPHSEISGSALICSSPKLFAACHVLHRLLMPRHSPCALFSLTFIKSVLLTSSLELCRLNRRFYTKLYLPNFWKIKVPHFLLLSCDLFRSHPLLPCFFIFFSVQFSRCKLRTICSKEIYPQNWTM